MDAATCAATDFSNLGNYAFYSGNGTMITPVIGKQIKFDMDTLKQI